MRRRVERCLLIIMEDENVAEATALAYFTRAAVQDARRHGLRLWRTEDKDHAALESLQILLEMKGSRGPDGQLWTGVNKNWVLDIWEIACARFEKYEEQQTRRGEAPVEGAELPRLAAFTVSSAPETTVTAPPLAEALLASHLEGDEERFISLLGDIEALLLPSLGDLTVWVVTQRGLENPRVRHVESHRGSGLEVAARRWETGAPDEVLRRVARDLRAANGSQDPRG